MKCASCGADNPDSAEFCSLCMEKLQTGAGSTAPSYRETGHAPGDSYVAPGEWRGDAEGIRPSISKVVETRVRRFRWKMVAYASIVVLVIIWIILSFTVWGNPSAEQRSMQLIEAANARDSQAFVGCFLPEEATGAEKMYTDVLRYLGGNGAYSDIRLDVDQVNNYDARSYIESGTITGSEGSTFSVDSSSNLLILLENHKGKWYVVLRGTDIVP